MENSSNRLMLTPEKGDLIEESNKQAKSEARKKKDIFAFRLYDAQGWQTTIATMTLQETETARGFAQEAGAEMYQAHAYQGAGGDMGREGSDGLAAGGSSPLPEGVS
jgi:hypothetical protein